MGGKSQLTVQGDAQVRTAEENVRRAKAADNDIFVSFNIQSDTPQNVVKYERMIAGYYRSRIQPQGSHRAPHLSYRQLRVKDLPKVPTWRQEVEPTNFRTEGTDDLHLTNHATKAAMSLWEIIITIQNTGLNRKLSLMKGTLHMYLAITKTMPKERLTKQPLPITICRQTIDNAAAAIMLDSHIACISPCVFVCFNAGLSRSLSVIRSNKKIGFELVGLFKYSRDDGREGCSIQYSYNREGTAAKLRRRPWDEQKISRRGSQPLVCCRTCRTSLHQTYIIQYGNDH